MFTITIKSIQVPIRNLVWYLVVITALIIFWESLEFSHARIARVTTEILLVITTTCILQRLAAEDKRNAQTQLIRRIKIRNYLKHRASRRCEHDANINEMLEYQNSALSNIDEHILLLDNKGEIVMYNKAWEKFTYEATGIIPKARQSIMEIIPAPITQWKSLFEKCLAGEELVDEFEFNLKDNLRTHRIRYTPVVHNLKVEGVMIAGRDVTELRVAERTARESKENLKAVLNTICKTEQLLEASEKKFRGLVENSQDLFLITNRQLICTFASQNIEEILGYTQAEIQGTQPLSLIHPNDVRQVREIAESTRAMTDGFRQKINLRVLHKNGNYKYLDGTGTNLYNTPGIEGRLLVFRDITTKVEQDRQVNTLNNHLSEFQNAIYSAAIISRTDSFGRITVVNENFIKASGYTRTELIGDTHKKINSNFHPPSFWTDMWQTITSKNTWRGEVKNRAKDGSYYWLDTFITPLVDEDGNIREYLAIRYDITERKNSEEKIRQYNERFELASKATKEAIWDWDIEKNVEVWNHGLKTIFGYDLQTIDDPQVWWEEKVHPDDLLHLKKTIADCFEETKEHWSASYRYLCAQGFYKYVFDRAYIVYKDRKPVRMIGAIQDITKETESRSEVEKLSLVARQTSNAVIIANSKNEIEWVNESFSKLTGYQPQEVIGCEPLPILLDKELDCDAFERINKSIKLNGFTEEEVLGFTKSREQFWQKLTIQTVFNDREQPSHFIYISNNITSHKNFEAQITATARELANLIDYANIPIFVIDRHAKVKQLNKIATMISGYSLNEIVGNSVDTLLDAEGRLQLQLTLHNVFTGSSLSNYELRIKNKSGQIIDLFAALTPTIDVTGEITGATIVAQDLTELLQYRNDLESLIAKRTNELNAALEKEKETVEMKSRFVSVASHEFRTPLTTITAATSMIRKSHEKMSQVEDKLNNIDKQVKHMTWLLDDILTIGKADAGKINVANTSLCLRQFFNKVCEETNNSMSNTHTIKQIIALRDESIFIDEKLMRNIVINLLTNAIKFSPGQSSVELCVKSTTKNLSITVSDRGIGIPENDMVKLFTSFQRGSNTGQIDGTGLGLTIVKKAVELLHGTISVQSQLGKGTSFIVQIPIDQSLTPTIQTT